MLCKHRGRSVRSRLAPPVSVGIRGQGIKVCVLELRFGRGRFGAAKRFRGVCGGCIRLDEPARIACGRDIYIVKRKHIRLARVRFDGLGLFLEWIRLVERWPLGAFFFVEDRRVIENRPMSWHQSWADRLTAMSSGMFEANWSLWAIPHEVGGPRSGSMSSPLRHSASASWRKGYLCRGDGSSIMRAIKCLKGIRWMPWC